MARKPNTFDKFEVTGYHHAADDENPDHQKVYLLSKEQFPLGHSTTMECLLTAAGGSDSSKSVPHIINVAR